MLLNDRSSTCSVPLVILETGTEIYDAVYQVSLKPMFVDGEGDQIHGAYDAPGQ